MTDQLPESCRGCDESLMELFAEMHEGENFPGSPFKTGDKVRLNSVYLKLHPGMKSFEFYTFTVTGVSFSEEDIYEYSLEGFPFLVWNTDIELIRSIQKE